MRLMYDNYCCAALSWLTSKDVWITSYSLPMTASITGTVEMKQVDRVLLCKMLASQDASDVDRAILVWEEEMKYAEMRLREYGEAAMQEGALLTLQTQGSFGEMCFPFVPMGAAAM